MAMCCITIIPFFVFYFSTKFPEDLSEKFPEGQFDINCSENHLHDLQFRMNLTVVFFLSSGLLNINEKYSRILKTSMSG